MWLSSVDPKVISPCAKPSTRWTRTSKTDNVYHLVLFLNWAVPPLHSPPDLLVLATDLAGLAGVTLPVEVSAIDFMGR